MTLKLHILSQSYKKYLQVILLLIALGAFAIYFMLHKEQFAELKNLTFLQFLLILFGQLVIIASNVLLLHILVAMTGKKIEYTSSARVVAYSSIVNFFGFLQGGLGVRGVYLKSKLGIPYKKYLALTILQYLFVFGISGLAVLVGLGITSNLNLWILAAIVLVPLLLLVSALLVLPNVTSRYYHQIKSLLESHHKKLLFALLIGVVIQITGSFIAFAVELHAVGAHLTFGGLLIFTGVAQLSVIVALTPGAIGFREGLLLLVQQQMTLSSGAIILGSTLDRLVYFVTLAIVTPLALAMKQRLKNIGRGNSV